jgi:hypothetical protein
MIQVCQESYFQHIIQQYKGDNKMLIKCTCKHEFQDKRYGKTVRVYNQKVDRTTYKCTVCGREQIKNK